MSSIATMVINLLAKTESFEKPMDRATRKIDTFDKRMKSLSKVAGVGIQAFAAGRALTTMLNAATAYHEAIRKGEDATGAMVDAFYKGIPIIGDSILGFAKEFSGLNATIQDVELSIKRLAAIQKISAAIKNTEESIDDRIAILKASEKDVDFVKAKIAYEKQINQLIQAQLAMDELGINGRERVDRAKVKAANEYYRVQLKIAEKQGKIYFDKQMELKTEQKLTEEKEKQALLEKNNRILDEQIQRGKDRVAKIEDALESIKTPEQKSFDEYTKTLEKIDLLYKKNYISLEKWKDLEQQAWETKIDQDNETKSKSPFDSSQKALQFNPADISLSGLAIGGVQSIQQQMLNEQKKIARNTDPANNKGTF